MSIFMRDKRPVDELSIEELERILVIKKREARQKQMERMKRSGRVVAPGTHAPPQADTFPNPAAMPSVTLPQFEDYATEIARPSRRDDDEIWRRFLDRLLLVVEVIGVIGLIYIGVNLVFAIGKLENETEAAQQMSQATRMASIPTLEPTPMLRPLHEVVLPGGHVFDENNVVQFNYDEIPANVLARVDVRAAIAPVIQRPPQTAETALIVNIPKLNLDQTIVQGTDLEALKEGVAQVLNGARPGDPTGNVVLAAHNDVYGELFRYIDQLEAGDRITVQTQTHTYTYIVTHSELVEPTDVHVMDDRGRPTLTLISCYPYRVNTKRIVVYAEREDNF